MNTLTKNVNDCCDSKESRDNYNVADCEGRFPSLTNTLYTEKKTLDLICSEKSSMNGLYQSIYSGCLDVNTVAWLEKHISSGKIEDGVLHHEIEYHTDSFGRFKVSKVNNESPYCHMYMKRIVKYYACKDIYDDIDFVNAQPVILEHLFLFHGLVSTNLSYYNNNRESVLNDICERNDMTRGEAKNFILRVLYAPVTSIKSDNDYINALCEEIDTNRKVIVGLYDDIAQYVDDKNIAIYKDKNIFNRNGKVLATIAQTLECRALCAMHTYITSNGGVVGALIHDGIHVEKEHSIDIDALKQFVFEETHIHLDIKVKEFKLPEYAYTDNQRIKFDTLAMKHPRVAVKKIKKKFLTKLNAKDKRGIDLYKRIKERQITLVKSYTGSGKTTMIQKFIEGVKVNIVSVVSRISLADAHAEMYKLKNYKTTKQHGVNEVYCYDSLRKLNLDNICAPFVLILDEVASLISHCFNTNHRMSSDRVNIVGHLRNLINHPLCSYVIGTDANINDGTLQFLATVTNKHIKLYHNTYNEKRDTPVNMYLDMDKALTTTIQLIMDGGKVFICSNRNRVFKEKICQTVIDQCGLVVNQNYLMYSGDEGCTEIDTTQWFKDDVKVVFATPSIVYGIDYNLPGVHTCGFYFAGNTMDAMGANQQINRIRKPESIHIFMNDNKCDSFDSIETVTTQCNVNDLGLKVNGSIQNVIDNMVTMKAIVELRAYDKFRESYHNNLRHHLLQLMRAKGYYNINVISEGPAVEVVKMDKKTFQAEQKQKALIIDSYEFKGDKKFQDIASKRECFLLDDVNVKGLSDEKKEEFDNVFIFDDKMFQSTLKYACLKNKRYQAYNKDGEIIDNDVIECKINSAKMKIQLLRTIRTKLGLPEYVSSETELRDLLTRENHRDDVVMSNEFRKKIQLCFKPKFVPTKLGDIVTFYGSKMKTLIPNIFQKVNNNCKAVFENNKKRKKYTVQRFDMNSIEKMNKLIRHMKTRRTDMDLYMLDKKDVSKKVKKTKNCNFNQKRK